MWVLVIDDKCIVSHKVVCFFSVFTNSYAFYLDSSAHWKNEYSSLKKALFTYSVRNTDTCTNLNFMRAVLKKLWKFCKR